METATTAILAFNLLCTGTQSVIGVGVGDSGKPYASEYRIDLEAGKWCESDCKALHQLASVQPTQITLQDTSEGNAAAGEGTVVNFINRETGVHYSLASSGKAYNRISIKWKGQCERKPFTGFPKFETKF